jgi:hypothetical protein
MKLSKTTWGLIGAGCFIVAAVIIFNMWNTAVASRNTAGLNLETSRKLYSAVVTQKANLNTQIAQIETTIKQGQEQVAKLQADFTQAEKDLQQAKIQFTALAESIEYSEYLLGFAKTANLEVLAIESSETGIADISETTDTFYSTRFTVNLKGKVADILSFIDLVVKAPAFKTGNIDSIAFDIPVPLTQAQINSTKAGIKANIKATIEAEQLALEAEQKALYAERLALLITSLSPRAMLVHTEQAILAVLEVPYSNLTVEEMAQTIRNIIGEKFGANIANQYTPESSMQLNRKWPPSL